MEASWGLARLEPSFLLPDVECASLNLAGEVWPAVGEPGLPGVLLRSLHGELPEVLSPERLSEFWRESPVPI